jgi:hypothetical protein
LKETSKSEIKTLIVHEGITKLPAEGCSGWYNLSEVSLPSTIGEIGDFAFDYCIGLTEISIPDSVTLISRCCFSGCPMLTKIRLPAKLERIETVAFLDCLSLTSIEFPSALTTIGYYAFSNTGLVNLTLPDSLVSVDVGCFKDCINLTEVVIGNSLKDVNNDMFNGCVRLKKVWLGDGVTRILSSAFALCTSLRSVRLGPNVETLADSVFAGAFLKEISLPDSLWSVAMFAFGTSNLTRLVLGPNVTYFDRRALGYDSQVTEVHIRSRPVNTHKSICGTLNHSGIWKKVEIFVGGGYPDKICGHDVHFDATMTPAPTNTRTRSPDPTRTAKTTDPYPSVTSVVSPSQSLVASPSKSHVPPTKTERMPTESTAPTRSAVVPTVSMSATPDEGKKSQKLLIGLVSGIGVLMVIGIVAIVVLLCMIIRRTSKKTRQVALTTEGQELGRRDPLICPAALDTVESTVYGGE